MVGGIKIGMDQLIAYTNMMLNNAVSLQREELRILKINVSVNSEAS